ncbi:MAG: hypothetical protein A2014_01630 [Spirochaetes bacterium GWF1_49_6]|nr:MAG: hypothetical protein A2014_01630 [Spirochaetes bacterium GWF1_49_6]
MRGIVLFSVVFFLSCTQEHLLLLKNIQNAQFLSFEQILDESGYTKYINRPKPVTNQLPPVADVMTTNQVSLVVILKTNFITNTSPALNGQTIVTQVVTLPVDPAKTIQSNKIITQIQNKKPPVDNTPIVKEPLTITPVYKSIEMIPGEEFSINIYEKDVLLTLKTVEGDIKFLKDKSNPSDGFFLFLGGNINSSVIFHGYTKTGKLIKKYIYQIKPMGAAVNPQPPQTTNQITISPEDTAPTNKGGGFQLSDTVISSLQYLSSPEKIKLLYKNIDSTEMSPQDKELLRYHLISILIDNFNFKESLSNINLLSDQYRKSLYMARMFVKQKKPLDALKNYYAALNGDNSVKKEALLEMESLYLKEGDIDAGALAKMEDETKRFIQIDPDFYARSMINIARLYQYIHDIYRSKDIFEGILKGVYSKNVLQEAKKYYDELKKNFLEYE